MDARVDPRAPQVVDHFEKPRNVGSFEKSDPNVGTGLVGAPACGDVMKLQIKARARFAGSARSVNARHPRSARWVAFSARHVCVLR